MWSDLFDDLVDADIVQTLFLDDSTAFHLQGIPPAGFDQLLTQHSSQSAINRDNMEDKNNILDTSGRLDSLGPSSQTFMHTSVHVKTQKAKFKSLNSLVILKFL